MRAALGRSDPARYEPAALGLPAARAAVAAEYAAAGTAVDPARVAITASSSESCSFLFKLLCDPGDAVLIPEPSYPLHDYLVRLEGVVPIGYRLAFDGVWSVDFASVEQALADARARGARPRAIVVVNPNNPTGGFLETRGGDTSGRDRRGRRPGDRRRRGVRRLRLRRDASRVEMAAIEPALMRRPASSAWAGCRSPAVFPI